MRSLISETVAPTKGTAGISWFPGLPHVAAAIATWPVFGGTACLSGLLMASFVSFVVWLPMTALALNGGQALAPDAPSPPLTFKAKLTLFALWAATAWAAAALAHQSMIGSA